MLGGMGNTPNIQPQSGIVGARYFALILSVVSTCFAFNAGHAHGSWFIHFCIFVVISQLFTVCCIGLLAFIRSRIGWLETYKHPATILTVLLLLPAQLMTFEITNASHVVVK